MAKWLSKEWCESNLKEPYTSKVNKSLLEVAKKIENVKDVPSMVSFAKEIIAIKGLKPLDRLVICALDPGFVGPNPEEYVKKLESFNPKTVAIPIDYPSVYMNTYGYDEILSSIPKEDEKEPVKESVNERLPETTQTSETKTTTETTGKSSETTTESGKASE